MTDSGTGTDPSTDRKLHHAGHCLREEADQLAAAAPSVREAYHLPREGYHDFYSAAIECSLLSVEVRQHG